VPAIGRTDRAIEAQLLDHIRILASDEFGGREPGTDGEAKTLRYIGKQLFEMGLVSGTISPPTHGTRRSNWSRANRRRVLRVFPARAADPFDQAQALLLTSGRRSLVQGAPIYFVGRGTTVPPRAELAGRVALLLDNQGDLGAKDTPYAGDRSQRQNALLAGGAAAVVTVLDGQRSLAGVTERRRRQGYALASEALGGDLEGFLSPEGLEQVLATSPDNLASLQRRPTSPISRRACSTFRPVLRRRRAKPIFAPIISSAAFRGESRDRALCCCWPIGIISANAPARRRNI
jgi:hypothetical protein